MTENQAKILAVMEAGKWYSLYELQDYIKFKQDARAQCANKSFAMTSITAPLVKRGLLRKRKFASKDVFRYEYQKAPIELGQQMDGEEYDD